MADDLNQSGATTERDLAAFVKGMSNTEAQKDTWKVWISGDLLFRALYDAVKRAEVARLEDALQLTERCEENLRKCLTEGLRGQARNQARAAFQRNWEGARALIWCAAQACRAPASVKPLRAGESLDAYRRSLEIERCCHALGTHEGWAWGTILTFLDAPIRGRAVYMPAAEFDEKTGKGLLNTLVLEVIETGANSVFHHPRDLFGTGWDRAFGESIQAAWSAAKALIEASDETSLCDGRWRILSGWSADPLKRGELRPAAEANGPSASGAVAWGWWFALTGKVPDDRVIAIAEIDADGNLSKVNGVGAKAKEIAEAGGFDTIAVVKENEAEAEEALTTIGKLGMVSVEDIATYEERVKERRARQEASAAK